MTKIALLGAASATGRLLLDRLASASDAEVTALARARPEGPAPAARWLTGDATDPETVAEAVSGAEVAITLVAARTGTAPGSVRSEATAVLLDVLKDSDSLRHLVVVSALGGSGSRRQLGLAARWVYRMAVGNERLVEVDRQEGLVAASGLRATVVRPPKLDDRPSSGYRKVTGGVGMSASLHRSDLAHCLADLALGEAPTGLTYLTVASK